MRRPRGYKRLSAPGINNGSSMLWGNSGAWDDRQQIFDRSFFTPILPCYINPQNDSPPLFSRILSPPTPENTQFSLTMPSLTSTTNGTAQYPAELDVRFSFFFWARFDPTAGKLTSIFLGFEAHRYAGRAKAATCSGVIGLWRGA